MGALVIFTANVPRLAKFYEAVLPGEPTLESSGDIRIRSDRDEVLVHAAHETRKPVDSTPSSSSPRTGSALKPVFEVDSLPEALTKVESTGGRITDRTFTLNGSTRHDVVDPDGNVVQLRD